MRDAKRIDKIALTFNQLKGTPSLILFNNKYEILQEWFGHAPYKQIVSKVLDSIK